MDADALKLFSFVVFSKLEGAVTAGMIHLGDHLGIYAAMAAQAAPMTSHDVAAHTELDERWVREWLSNQAAARIVQFDGVDRFWLSEEAVAVLATPDHPAFGMGMFHRLPATMQALEHVRESFRHGIGHDYDSHGEDGAVGIERSFEPWSNAHLLPTVLPSLDGVTERLASGASVADVGCGAGSAVLQMAAAFTRSSFVGYDVSQHALERARTKLAERGLGNARFVDPRIEPLPTDGSIDLVTTFDCIHDMTRPDETIAAIRAALRDDGTWLLVDIKARDSLAENIATNPMASMMYGISVLSCMSSALSEAGGAGLGTLGLPEGAARRMAGDAGFTRFRRLPIDHPVNAFYEVRP